MRNVVFSLRCVQVLSKSLVIETGVSFLAILFLECDRHAELSEVYGSGCMNLNVNLYDGFIFQCNYGQVYVVEKADCMSDNCWSKSTIGIAFGGGIACGED